MSRRLVTLLVVAWAEWRHARGVLDLEEPYSEDEAGKIRRHPATGVAADAWRRVSSMLAEFGLTPASRSRLQVVAATGAPRTEGFRRPLRPDK